MTRKGWVKDGEGFWARDGARFKIVIDVFAFMMDFAPVLVEQLRQRARSLLHAPLYHSQFVQPTGSPTPYFWRWSNEEFDAVVDEMGTTDPSDPQLQALFHRALEVWLPHLPAIPLLQFYHRIPHNQTYWTNWPSAQNLYINSAYWHRTWLLVLLGLAPAQG